LKLAAHRLSLGAQIGFAIVLANLIAIVFAPIVAPHDQADLIGDVWAPPNVHAWLGTDQLGRDMLSRMLYGGRTSVTLALVITALAVFFGGGIGIVAATLPRWIDILLARIADVVMSVPQLILALVVLSVLGTSIPVLIGTIAIIQCTGVFRVARAVAMNIVVLDYVEVARGRGERLWWVIRREIVPNALLPLIAEFGLRFCFTLLFITSLSFLGLGVQPPTADWGSMVRENALAINLGGVAPLFPAGAIALLTIGVNLVADWLLSIHGHAHGEGA
jgi:peptide/nickel transport system permease protein